MANGRRKGRPTLEVDLDVVRKLASINCTEAEIAAFLGMTPRSFFTKKTQDPRIAELIDQGNALGSISIKREQMRILMRGNPTMGIWLGKVRCGQRDPATMGQPKDTGVNAGLDMLIKAINAGPALGPIIPSQPGAGAEMGGADSE